MNWLQLDPQSIASRVAADPKAKRAPDLLASVVRGAVGFMWVSIAGFAPWALAGRSLHRAIGEVGMYGVCAVVFIGLSGVALHRLIIGPGSLTRFYQLFGVGFGAYAILWIMGWMLWRGHLGGLAGLLAGTSAMGWVFVRAFRADGELLKVIGALFLLNALGYFLGGWVEGHVAASHGIHFLGLTLSKSERMRLAMLLWGGCYGLGFGAGLGLAFFACQSQARALIREVAIFKIS